uniref:Uncharacterized protein n=1 Tax=Arundo donax TaxID=35708 RepID=A0A0A8Y596_ARUDO
MARVGDPTLRPDRVNFFMPMTEEIRSAVHFFENAALVVWIGRNRP